MRARIERFIKPCDVCQRCKFPNRALVGEMHSIIAENPGDLVTVDYYGPLPASRSRVTYIFVVIDAFSKFVRLYPLCRAQAKISAKKIVGDFHRFIPPNKRAFWCKKKYLGEGRNIVYNDESYLHSSHTSPYGWYDRGDNCLLKAPIGKGQYLIMVHCGCEKEFVSNARLMFKSRSKSGDYHDDVNHKNCEYMKLLPNLEENSVLVIDNASYHNVQVDRTPTSVTKTNVEYFVKKKETKPELYQTS
jgi:hypothetical protein